MPLKRVKDILNDFKVGTTFSMQEYMSKTLSSVIASPYFESVADNSHISDRITGERKVMGTCHIHGILT
jgi:hypothetical protein